MAYPCASGFVLVALPEMRPFLAFGDCSMVTGYAEAIHFDGKRVVPERPSER